jgi:acetyl-CoA carboxylase, biotin carboxylase subunit
MLNAALAAGIWYRASHAKEARSSRTSRSRQTRVDVLVQLCSGRHTNLFHKVLIANRGEIAVRVIRALREMDIRSVAVFSEADRRALHVQMADEAVCVGPAPSSESYLVTERILDAARATGAEAIHPGYGFLSENAAFAKSCTDAGIKFIGPTWEAIEQMGSKTAARRLAIQAGAPVVPGTEQGITNNQDARSAAAKIGFPVLLKAAAGGGGKGMRRVDNEADLEAALRDASSEAVRAFGSGEVYIEKLIERPRHIEVQILGDEHGHLIHLGERECSIQRRHQKVIEESPSPLVLSRPELRNEIGEAALRIARAANYSNAGTLEFLADQEGRFYFLEMNTRLQVEHPVTEWVTGLDLVRWQIRIAAGEPLTLSQRDVYWTGSSIECRVYAEDPDNNFFPSPGTVLQYAEPAGPGVRVDTGVYPGWTVPIDYDPLLAKLSVWGETRESAIKRMSRALAEYRVLGITSNLALFERIMRDPDFAAGKLHTGFLDERMKGRAKTEINTSAALAGVLAAAQIALARPQTAENIPAGTNIWRAEARRGLLR